MLVKQEEGLFIIHSPLDVNNVAAEDICLNIPKDYCGFIFDIVTNCITYRLNYSDLPDLLKSSKMNTFHKKKVFFNKMNGR